MRVDSFVPPKREPVRRTHFVHGAAPREVYDVVVDFEAYPRLFTELTATRVIERDGGRVRVEFNVQVVIPARYVLDLTCDPEALTVEWTFVEGKVVTHSAGGWRFRGADGGTWIEYFASLEVRAPLPGFVLRKISDAIVSLSLPAMFAAITREVGTRRR